MKLDPKNIRYLSPEDWRVLTAVEQGSRNHEVVPTPLIISLSNTRSGGSGVHRSISQLAKLGLIARLKNARYDGYRLTYGGLDYLALHAHLKAGALASVGNQIGVGKESDIFVVASPAGRRLVLKLHRLGRISFRTVKANRDYLRNGRAAGGSWMHMSRLAALKEFTFMRALRDAGFVVPEPVACNRHTVVMELIDAFPLRQISRVPDPPALYAQLVEMIVRLAGVGLIHGDFNEFNILVEEVESPVQPLGTSDTEDGNPDTPSQPLRSEPSLITLKPVLIDFPQMVSVSHPNAAFYFDRDVACIKRFFERRFSFVADEPGPFLDDVLRDRELDGGPARRLDVEVEASGFSSKMARELDGYMKDVGVDGDANGSAAVVGDDYDDGEGTGGEGESAEDGADGEAGRGDAVDDDPVDADCHGALSELADGMTVLELRGEQTAAKEASAYTPSVVSTVRGSKSSMSAAKAAQGWVI